MTKSKFVKVNLLKALCFFTLMSSIYLPAKAQYDDAAPGQVIRRYENGSYLMRSPHYATEVTLVKLNEKNKAQTLVNFPYFFAADFDVYRLNDYLNATNNKYVASFGALPNQFNQLTTRLTIIDESGNILRPQIAKPQSISFIDDHKLLLLYKNNFSVVELPQLNELESVNLNFKAYYAKSTAYGFIVFNRRQYQLFGKDLKPLTDVLNINHLLQNHFDGLYPEHVRVLPDGEIQSYLAFKKVIRILPTGESSYAK